jgi:hypothetical protein
MFSCNAVLSKVFNTFSDAFIISSMDGNQMIVSRVAG